MSWSPYGMRCVPSETDNAASTVWNTKPMTLYCKNHAVIEAGPTVRYGANKPFLRRYFPGLAQLIGTALTNDELAIMATFSKGIVQYRTTTGVRRPILRSGTSSGRASRGSRGATSCTGVALGVSETALAARALAILAELGSAMQPESAHACSIAVAGLMHERPVARVTIDA